MNKSWRLLLLIATVFLLSSSVQVECRRTYSSRSSSSGRGNRGKNQPSGSGIFSSWFGGSKSSGSGSGSGSVSKPASGASKSWQTASSHATGQSKPSSGWANPYYKPSAPAPAPQTNYGWKPASVSNSGSHSASNVGSRGYPVQSGVQHTPQSSFGGYKPSPGASGASATHYQPTQTGFGGYRPASNVPATHNAGYHPSPAQSGYGGYHAPAGHHPQPQTPHAYQPSHQPSYHPPAPHYPQSSYSSHLPPPTYQSYKPFGGSSHYGYPGSGSWGIDTYGARKSGSSGTGKLLTGLAVGAAGGYLTSSLVNSISNPWKYSGYGYGSSYGYGSGYGLIRSRDESAFERGYERGVQARQNENNNNNNNNNNREAAAPPPPEDPSSKWIQCVAFDPQTQQTLINPNCSCTVTTSSDERTGQPLSVHHCTTLNGLVMRPIPVQPGPGGNAALPQTFDPQAFSGGNVQPGEGVNVQPVGGVNEGAVPSYGDAYLGNFQYGGGATVYIPPRTETKVEAPMESKPVANEKEPTPKAEAEPSTTEAKPEEKTERATGTVTEGKEAAGVTEAAAGEGGKGEAPPAPEELAGAPADDRKRTAEFYGQLQKIVNMGSFV